MPRELVTPRLRLRPPVAADAEAIFRFTGDPAVTRFMTWATHEDIDDSLEFIEAVAEGWAAGDECGWVLIDRHDDRPVGTFGCLFDEHGAELGYVLAQQAWGQGLASEAARAVFEALVGQADIHRIWASCDVDNIASQRVLERIGLVREARLARWSPRPNLDPGGLPRDVYIHAWVR